MANSLEERSWTNSHPCRNRRRSRFQDLRSALIADSMLSSASDRTRVGAALWRIHVENLKKRLDKRFGVLRAGECGNAVDDKEGHAVESSLLSFSLLFEPLFKSFVAFDKPPEIRCRQTGFGGYLGQHFIFPDVAPFREVGSEEGVRQSVLQTFVSRPPKETMTRPRIGRYQYPIVIKLHPERPADLRNFTIHGLRAFPAPELRGAISLSIQPRLWHIRIQLKRAPDDVGQFIRAQCFQPGLQSAPADVAPRADQVGKDFNVQRVHNVAFCFRFLSRFSVRKLGSVPKHYALGLQSSP